jgi:hypothetical protein
MFDDTGTSVRGLRLAFCLAGVLLIAGLYALAPPTARANHVPNADWGGSDSAGYPVELRTSDQQPGGDAIRFASSYYCSAGVVTPYITISQFSEPHSFSFSNFAGTHQIDGEFPSPGVVTGHVVLTDCGIDLTYEAVAGADPPPPPPCTPEPDPLGFYCFPDSGSPPPSTSPPGEDDSAACEQAKQKVKKLKQKLKGADSPDEKAKVKKKLKKAKKAEAQACA